MTSPKPLHLASKSLAIVGCPFSGGQHRGGVDDGPNSLVEAGLIQQLTSLGWNVTFDGHNVDQFHRVNQMFQSAEADPDIGRMKNPRAVSQVCSQVRDAVGKVARQKVLPLTLGGDHSLGIGTVAGTLSGYPDAGLIWVDAHADINTPLTTDSGNLHGCPVSFLLGLEGTDVEPFNQWLPLAKGREGALLRTDSLVYIGLRDVDRAEREILRKYGIKCFSMHEVDKYGIGKVVDMALDHLNGDVPADQRKRPIHLSFDVDALDPSVAPSTGTPVRGGLTFREGHYICEALYETGCLVAMDLMEVNPSLMKDHAEQTVAIGCSLIRSAMGETLL